MSRPMMPKATAVWLIDNTSLTFEQIGDFCGLHVLEVKGIADGDVATGIKGLDPVSGGQLSREELDKAQADPGYTMSMEKPRVEMPTQTKRKGPRYTPVSRRQDRPNAIAWLLRNHPELKDSQICKLVGTTKPTIVSIRDRTHWNIANFKPADPVTLGLCSQIELDEAITIAQKNRVKTTGTEETEPKLKPTEESLEESKADPDISSVFGEEAAAPKPEASEPPVETAEDVFGDADRT
ncbi:MAG: cell cycle transcriptional regulator TrcR [Pseudomonadota bacterium]